MINIITALPKKAASFLKNDSILAIAFLLAITTCFFIKPDKAYLGYIDVNTIILLFCLMLIVEAFKFSGFFDTIGRIILSKADSEKKIVTALVLMCFFSSMLITNDVALITFVPLGLIVLESTNMNKHLCLSIAAMTISSNLGSMLTPIGNPQNVYLFSISGISLKEFFLLMFPYATISLILLMVIVFLRYDHSKLKSSPHISKNSNSSLISTKSGSSNSWLYILLFALSIAALMGYMNIYLLLGVVIVAVAIDNRSLFKKVDYNLLATFICFFIFTGNINRFEPLREMLISMLSVNEKLVSIVASQFISNVPAALLLSNYTADIKNLLIGTNLGGLGTLIASMASLISYKLLISSHPEIKSRYIVVFSVLNILFLGILYFVSTIL